MIEKEGKKEDGENNSKEIEEVDFDKFVERLEACEGSLEGITERMDEIESILDALTDE